MSTRWLIAADDLTGAADCAIAFTKVGLPSAVVWGKGTADAPVLSVNIESRAMKAKEAAQAHASFLQRLWDPSIKLYKKIDSTLRGQPAAELAETLNYLEKAGKRSLAIVCPAFPSTGRTTENGSVMINGVLLENSPIWARDHTYSTSHLPSLLAEAGIKTDFISLDVVRSTTQSLSHRIEQALQEGGAALVCDATSEKDLDSIAKITLPYANSLLWVGSAGLAAALARAGNPVPLKPVHPLPKQSGGVLIAVGSLSEISRASSQHIANSGKVLHVLADPDSILSAPNQRLDDISICVTQALSEGHDVLLEIALSQEPDLKQGKTLMDNLAQALQPAATMISGLVATGGDTAVALLNHFGVSGLDLVEEVESGIPLGLSIGAIRVPVVTKAGAFGSETTLLHCLSRIKEITAQSSS